MIVATDLHIRTTPRRRGDGRDGGRGEVVTEESRHDGDSPYKRNPERTDARQFPRVRQKDEQKGGVPPPWVEDRQTIPTPSKRRVARKGHVERQNPKRRARETRGVASLHQIATFVFSKCSMASAQRVGCLSQVHGP